MIDKRTAFGNYQEFKDKKGNTKVVLENDQFVSRGSLQTIRLLNCKILTLTENKRCKPCLSYRSKLNTLSRRVTKTSNDSSGQFHPKTNNQQIKGTTKVKGHNLTPGGKDTTKVSFKDEKFCNNCCRASGGACTRRTS